MEARKRAHGGKAAGARNGFVQHTPAGCTGIHMACGAVYVRMDAQDGCDLLEGEEGQLLDALEVLPTLCAEMPHINHGQIPTTFMWLDVGVAVAQEQQRAISTQKREGRCRVHSVPRRASLVLARHFPHAPHRETASPASSASTESAVAFEPASPHSPRPPSTVSQAHLPSQAYVCRL
jgi:hypothetical protein